MYLQCHHVVRTNVITSSAPFLNSLKEEMKLDIDSLASASFKLHENQKWSVDGEFRKVTDEEDMDIDIWVFQHTTHMYASNCYYRNFESFFCIYTKRGEFRVCSKPDHKVLTCFFHDNLALLEVYKHKLKKKGGSDEFYGPETQNLQQILAGHKQSEDGDLYYTGGASTLRGSQISEDIWLKRLVAAMSKTAPTNCTIKFTGGDSKNFDVRQSAVTGLTVDGINSYPFRGAPDITVKKKSAISTGSESATEGDLSSEDDAGIEVKLVADKQSAAVTPKVRELFAQMHVLLVQKCLRRLLVKKQTEKFTVKKPVSCKGLYLSRLNGGQLYTMTMPIIEVVADGTSDRESVATVTTMLCGDAILSKSRLCYLLNELY